MKIKAIAIFVLITLMTLFSSFGYAQISDTLIISGTGRVEPFKGIYISRAIPKDSSATVTDYIGTTLFSEVTLGDSDSSSAITVTITNNSGSTKVFNTVKYLEDAYSNENIKFTLDGIATGTAITSDNSEGKNTITFDIIFSYAGSTYSNPDLTSVLLFEFAEAADWEGGDTGGGGNEGGDGDVHPGEDFMALISAAMSGEKNSYGLNDKNKGGALTSNIKSKNVLYSTDNISGGNIKHFATEEIDTHNLDFMFEYSSDTEIILYIWRIAEVEADTTVIGETEIAVYKQAYHKINGTWEKSTTLAGRSVVIETRNNDGDDIIAIDRSQWKVGLPK